MAELTWLSLPGGDGETEAGAGFELGTNIAQEFFDDEVALGDCLRQDFRFGCSSEGAAEVGFGCDKVGGGLPGVAGSVGDFKLETFGGMLIVACEPLQIVPGIVDHARFAVGAEYLVAHEAGFLEDDAGAAEGIEDCLSGRYEGW